VPGKTPPGADDFDLLVKAIVAAIAQAGAIPTKGATPEDLAPRYRVSADKVRAWIKAGKLKAVNTADAKVGKPRYVVLPEHLAEFERARSAAPTPKPPRRKRQSGAKDFFPD
jgi:hypothetical protein